MSWVVADHSFEEPVFDTANLPYPDIGLRVALVTGQQIAYGGQTGLKQSTKAFYHRIFKKQANRFAPYYVDKVQYLFYCRPPPRKVELKKSTLRKSRVPQEIIPATKEDEEKLEGIKAIFGDSSSSDSEG